MEQQFEGATLQRAYRTEVALIESQHSPGAQPRREKHGDTVDQPKIEIEVMDDFLDRTYPTSDGLETT